MKTKKCITCNKRRVKQQEWKTEEEKVECFTCSNIKTHVVMFLDLMKGKADEAGIDMHCKITFKPYEPTQ